MGFLETHKECGDLGATAMDHWVKRLQLSRVLGL